MYYTPTIKDPIKVTRRRWNIDARGGLAEILRCDDPEFTMGKFGQAYITTVMPGVIKAWHLHREQTDRMMLVKGLVRFACINCVGLMVDPEEPYVDFENFTSADVCLDLIVSGRDPCLITIPEGIYHGFKNIGDEEAYIINIPTNVYNREHPDEVRIFPNDFYSKKTKNSLFSWQISING